MHKYNVPFEFVLTKLMSIWCLCSCSCLMQCTSVLCMGVCARVCVEGGGVRYYVMLAGFHLVAYVYREQSSLSRSCPHEGRILLSVKNGEDTKVPSSQYQERCNLHRQAVYFTNITRTSKEQLGLILLHEKPGATIKGEHLVLLVLGICIGATYMYMFCFYTSVLNGLQLNTSDKVRLSLGGGGYLFIY